MRNKRLTRFVLAAAGTAAVATATVVGTAAPAAAANGVPGQTMTICAETLYLRTDPAGAIIDILPYGSHFNVHRISDSGDWVRGYSVFSARTGWVQNGWFC